MKAYMFINSMRGQSLALTKAIRGVGGVLSADAITGDYDIIASVEVRDLTELRTAMAGVQALDGVQDHHLHGPVRLTYAHLDFRIRPAPYVGGRLWPLAKTSFVRRPRRSF